MRPEEIKEKVQGAYKRAMSSSTQVLRDSSLAANFRDLKLYGREAGLDFVVTHLDLIVREAVSTAECRQPSLTVPFYQSGRAAIEGIAGGLRDLTGLKVEAQQNGVKLIWAEPNLGLI